MVKALIVGASGGLGRAIRERLPAGWDARGLTHAELDISRRNDVVDRVQETRPDIIFNCAGMADVDQCEVDKWQAYLVNRDGAKHLAAAAEASGALLVLPSTDLVFDGSKTTPYREEDPPNPLSIFGDTKLAAELATMNLAPRHLIVRTGWLFGVEGKSRLVELLERSKTEEIVLGFDDHRSQPTPYGDYAAALIELARQNQTGVWHAAGLGECTEFELGKACFEILGLDPERVKAVRRGAAARSALRPRYSVLDGAKLARAGVRMRPWIESLREHLAQK